ncbi:hypothetical protein C8F01DRAFT_206480 [Mycena amicta]|nr:hypothetical protein C8F01DRAFT_206480 [Mycena amicta]
MKIQARVLHTHSGDARKGLQLRPRQPTQTCIQLFRRTSTLAPPIHAILSISAQPFRSVRSFAFTGPRSFHRHTPAFVRLRARERRRVASCSSSEVARRAHSSPILPRAASSHCTLRIRSTSLRSQTARTSPSRMKRTRSRLLSPLHASPNGGRGEYLPQSSTHPQTKSKTTIPRMETHFAPLSLDTIASTP